MANLETAGLRKTLIAAEDFTDKIYRFIVIDTDGKAAIAGNGVEVDGVMQEEPEAGYAGKIDFDGISFVEVGTGGVTAGAKVASDASGKAVLVASGDAVAGKAMAAGSAGGLVAVLLQAKDKNTVNDVIKVSLTSSGDLTGSQGSAVVVDTDGNIAVAGAGVFALGILVNAPDTGEEAIVAVVGKATGIAGEALTAGDVLATDASGRLVDVTAGDPACGIALADAAAADDSVLIVLVGRGVELIA